MRSIISAKFCNRSDLASFGIRPMESQAYAFDHTDPDLSDIGVDMTELEAVNRSLSAHDAEVEAADFEPRRSYKISDYLGQTPPTSPARAMRRRLAA